MNRIPKILRTFFVMLVVILISQILVRWITDDSPITFNAKFIFSLLIGTAVGTAITMLLTRERKPRSANGDEN